MVMADDPTVAKDDPGKRLSPGNFGRIAKRTGHTKQHISRVCRGLRVPSFDVAANIARAAGVTMDQLHAHTLKSRKMRVV